MIVNQVIILCILTYIDNDKLNKINNYKIFFVNNN